jgi:hypothetical protein
VKEPIGLPEANQIVWSIFVLPDQDTSTFAQAGFPSTLLATKA